MKGQWEERFERSCGHWRGFVDDVVYAFLDCGDLDRHIPAPRLHVARYYGHYVHVCRARRRQAGAESQSKIDAQASADDDGPTSAERKRLRRQWAELIRRIYEVDPLLCSCGAQMRILSFITDPPVVRQILQHLHTLGINPARGPPPPAQPLALVS